MLVGRRQNIKQFVEYVAKWGSLQMNVVDISLINAVLFASIRALWFHMCSLVSCMLFSFIWEFRCHLCSSVSSMRFAFFCELQFHLYTLVSSVLSSFISVLRLNLCTRVSSVQFRFFCALTTTFIVHPYWLVMVKWTLNFKYRANTYCCGIGLIFFFFINQQIILCQIKLEDHNCGYLWTCVMLLMFYIKILQTRYKFVLS